MFLKFLKLIMPPVDRHMKCGVVGKWHKTEGDQVDYGDGLVDVKIELAMSVLDRGSPEQVIRLLRMADLCATRIWQVLRTKGG